MESRVKLELGLNVMYRQFCKDRSLPHISMDELLLQGAMNQRESNVVAAMERLWDAIVELDDDVFITREELWMEQAPNFNFELDKDQLLAKALERGYVTPVEGEADLYKINLEYHHG